MTATDKLRKMLDERGVEWTASGTDTCWTSADGYPMRAWDTTNGTHMRVADLTPEQAIAATLGAGTCRMDVLDTGNEAAYEHYEYIMHCANCHHEFGYVQYNEDGDTWMDDKPRFCPNCGRKVER